MKLLSLLSIPFLLASVSLTSCSTPPAPTATPMQATAAVSTATVVTETNTALPQFLPTATVTPSPTAVLPTESSISVPGGIVYYYFVDLSRFAPSSGNIVVMPDALVLAPAQLDAIYGSDITADLRTALEFVLKDERNDWLSDKLQIQQISFSEGHVNVVLEGEYFAVAPVVLTAARAQILLTLFANAAVQSATVTINGGNIANISISHSMDAKPDDYAYTRAEIEAFIAENAYVQP